jgi:RNA polymerase subunit RPABC4/transcription elongation factor Spt4
VSAARTNVKFCRHCGRMIEFDAGDCPYCGKDTIRKIGLRECPFCGEQIRGKALKCKHCGEFVDGRVLAPQTPANVIYVDKAVIAGNGVHPGVVTPGPPPSELGRPAASAGMLPGPPPPRLPEGERRSLPPGTVSGPPAVRQPAALTPRAAGAEAPVPAPIVRAAPQPPPRTGRTEKPRTEARYDCPSCRRNVFEEDNFCENCGRDLRKRHDRPEFAPPPEHYEPADYALMLATSSPLGLLFGSAVAVALSCAAAGACIWSLWRVLTSAGRLRGALPAAGGLLAALFWAAAVLAFT